MRTIITATAAGLATLIVSGCVTDEFAASKARLTQQHLSKEIALKPLAAGTTFTFSVNDGTTRQITVKKMDGFSILQEQRGPEGTEVNENVGFGPTLSSRERMSASERASVAELFPLKVGRRTASGHSGTTASGFFFSIADTQEAVTMEMVTVPAGTFETIVIRTEMGNPRWWGQNTCWYAPAIGYCAKRKWRSAGSNWDWELVSVAP